MIKKECRILFVSHGNSDYGAGRKRPYTHLSLQNAAGKKQITTVLLLLVIFAGYMNPEIL